MDMTDGTNQHVHVAAGEFLNIASSVNQVTVAFWQKNYSIPSTSSFWAEPQSCDAGPPTVERRPDLLGHGWLLQWRHTADQRGRD